jgi:23S rRNA A2030 N6-methylase RlmJ
MRILAALDPAVVIDDACARYAEVTATYMVRLQRIVGSLETLTTGAHGFDYAVSVTTAEKLRIMPLLADLTFEIESEYGAVIKTLANACADVDRNAPALSLPQSDE